jgi:hypothetical protein
MILVTKSEQIAENSSSSDTRYPSMAQQNNRDDSATEECEMNLKCLVIKLQTMPQNKPMPIEPNVITTNLIAISPKVFASIVWSSATYFIA